MDSQYSLSHTTTPHNTHTLALTTKTAAGDNEEAPAVKERSTAMEDDDRKTV